ncbi:hypothetical protein Glove_526g19 [Diversispora epigaea]|uniref:Integrase catalytic domain-containing protein n=1 Tax=Diversispora epigaea TaxID=1348612 RepID=A0A397GHU3_9GLOM|nr:hypothetical protein Glove_526g19 [Diversispora epigaea]
MPYDKVDNITYMFCLNCIDIASRYKGGIAIGTSLDVLNMDKDDFSLEGILTSVVVAEAFVNLINNPDNHFSWNKMKLVMTDKGSKFKGDFEKLLKKHVQELILLFSQRSRVWQINLPIIYALLNDTIIRLIGMTSNKACKKKHVYVKSSKPRNGPMGFDEKRLSYNVSVRYLLKPGELESGRRRATNCNWSPQIYHIKELLIQKNQPILYWLIDDNGIGSKRSFVMEEILEIPANSELPPQWILKN